MQGRALLPMQAGVCLSPSRQVQQVSSRFDLSREHKDLFANKYSKYDLALSRVTKPMLPRQIRVMVTVTTRLSRVPSPASAATGPKDKGQMHDRLFLESIFGFEFIES